LTQLTVIVITKNEAANIRECLQSVAFADQTVVLDSGSTDDTLAIAREMGAHVHESAEWPGFGAQKNRALQYAIGQWVLSIDADERIPPDLASVILATIQSGTADAYALARHTQFCGQWIKHCGWTPDYVVRLFRREKAHFSMDVVHEKLILKNPVATLQRLAPPMLHYSYRTSDDYWSKLQRYSKDWALQRYRQGQTTSMSRAALSGLVAFVRSYFFRLGFLDGAMGFAVCSMQAQSAFGKYFELYCLHLQNVDTSNKS
jgi:glycosyltransferase involved in cell wall biosynthesis